MVKTWEAEAIESAVGKIMVANSYSIAHTGGGCLVWERPIDGSHYLWICDEGQGLGESPDEPFLVGCYDQDGSFDNASMPNLAAAITWCNERAVDPDRFIAAYNARAEFADVLDILVKNDGACLYWQMPDVARGEAAVAAGLVSMVDDLLVHPDATEVEKGMCYTMEKRP